MDTPAPRRSRAWVPGAAVTLALGLMVAVCMLAAVSTRTIGETSLWVEHTHQVIEALDALVVSLQEAESARRAFALTGDETDSEASRQAATIARRRVDALRRLTIDNPAQQASVDLLERLVDGRMTTLDRALAGRSPDFDRARETEATQEGRALTAELRRQVESMASVERSLLGIREGLSADAIARERRVITAGAALSVLLVAGALASLLREIAQRKEVATVLARQARILSDDAALKKKLAEDVREAHEFLDSIVENIPIMVFVKGASRLAFERVNRAGEELLGLSRDGLLGKTDFDFFPSDQATAFQSVDRATLEAGVVVDIPEEPIDTATGRRWLHTKKIPLLDANGRPSHLLGISEDITERKRASEALQGAHDELELRVAGRTAELVRANAELAEQIRVREQTEATLRKTEEQLQHSQRMEAIGRLAGGIAHDFNNMLSVILSYAVLLKEELPSAKEDLDEIVKAGTRAASLTKQLLAFSRRQMMQVERLSPMVVVVELETMLRRLIGENIVLAVKCDPATCFVNADVGQLEQVIVNLVVNARDAMPRGGKLTIETSTVTLDEAYVARHRDARVGRHAVIAVTDSGVGMDPSVQARIFEPFFTTKPKGSGTGLGLATVYGIVKQSGGNIWVYSEPGRGTSFKIYLPEAPGTSEMATTRPSIFARDMSGTEIVLLVEDDEQVRRAAIGILRRLGYEVHAAADPAEAIALMDAGRARFDLLVTDVVMPGMSGKELAALFSARYPRAGVLYMSGYTDNTIVHHGVLDPGIEFLEKPFTPDKLSRRVKEVLARRRSP